MCLNNFIGAIKDTFVEVCLRDQKKKDSKRSFPFCPWMTPGLGSVLSEKLIFGKFARIILHLSDIIVSKNIEIYLSQQHAGKIFSVGKKMDDCKFRC